MRLICRGLIGQGNMSSFTPITRPWWLFSHPGPKRYPHWCTYFRTSCCLLPVGGSPSLLFMSLAFETKLLTQFLAFIGRSAAAWPQMLSWIPVLFTASPIHLDTSLLEKRCRHFLVQGLAPSSCKSSTCGQRKFYDFCLQAGKLHSNRSPCPVEEWTLSVCFFPRRFYSAFVYQS